jgi:N6-adenosine-specific RNA methylase IME4
MRCGIALHVDCANSSTANKVVRWRYALRSKNKCAIGHGLLIGSVWRRVMTLDKYASQFDIVYADPPWPHYGDPNKDAACGKHYDLMSMTEIKELPIRSLFRDKMGALFVWATCPRLDLALEALDAWDLHYRGVAFVWVKCRHDGVIINGQGVPPTGTKPTTELCLLATTNKRGRPFPLLDAGVGQVIVCSTWSTLREARRSGQTHCTALWRPTAH